MTMVLPPFVVNVRMYEDGAHDFRIWLPLFLLWPLLFVIVAIALVFTLLADIVGFLAGGRFRFTRLLLGALRLLAEIRGTHAHIKNATQLVDVDIY